MVQIVVSIPGETSSCPEWAIVELQGDLETRHPVPLSGKFIGDLHFTHKDAPILIIGHHILHGKIHIMEKPLAVMTKGSGQNNLMETGEQGGQTCYNVQALIRKKILFKTRPKPIIAHVPKKL